MEINTNKYQICREICDCIITARAYYVLIIYNGNSMMFFTNQELKNTLITKNGIHIFLDNKALSFSISDDKVYFSCFTEGKKTAYCSLMKKDISSFDIDLLKFVNRAEELFENQNLSILDILSKI